MCVCVVFILSIRRSRNACFIVSHQTFAIHKLYQNVQSNSVSSRYLFVYGNFHSPMCLLSSNPSPVSRSGEYFFKNWFLFCFYMCPGPQYSLFFTQFTYTIIRNHCMPVKCIRLIFGRPKCPIPRGDQPFALRSANSMSNESANAAASLRPYHFIIAIYFRTIHPLRRSPPTTIGWLRPGNKRSGRQLSEANTQFRYKYFGIVIKKKLARVR